MNVSSIGAASFQPAFSPAAAAAKPEAAEVAGAPDHDGDSGDRAATVNAQSAHSVSVLA
jgi:hypothetical protein